MRAQRGGEDVGGAIGIGLLGLLILVVAIVATSPKTIAPAVQYEYQRCMAAAQTPGDQHLCDPTTPTPAPR